MSSLSAYTPLESLLLFQALHADGVASLSFNAISDQLRSIPLIRNDATYDTARLSPGALKNFYLGLLKDEAKRDLENERGDKEDAHNGHLSPGSRKRKAPSPSLPTLVEAARQSHLIPRLVQRLYAGYREKVAAEIEEDEARYDALSREIQDIERGEWDERLRSQHGADGYRPGANVQDDKGRAAANGDLPLPPPRSAEASPRIGQTARGTPSARAHQATIDAVINHGPDTVAGGGSPHQRNSITALPPLSEMAPESPRPFSRPPSQHAHSPQLPQSLPPGAGYRHSPPVSHQPPYAPPYPRPAVAQGPSPSPKLQNALNGLSPSSPRPMLPLPAGMKFAPPSPVLHNGMPTHRPQQPMPPHQPPQYPSPNQRMAPVPLPPADRRPSRGLPPPPPPPPHLPTPSNYHQQYPPPHPPYPGHQPQYPAQQQVLPPAAYPARPPHQGGIQLPPFQVSAQEPNKAHQQQLAQQAAAQHSRSPLPAQPTRPLPPGYPPYPPYQQSNAQPLPPPPPSRPDPRLVRGILTGLNRRPRPTWKSTRSRPPVPPRSPSPPAFEPMSPVRKQEANHLQASNHAPAEAAASDNTPGAEDAHAQTEEPASAPPSNKSARRNRKNSTASSAIANSMRGRTRSQSVATVTGEQISQQERPTSTRKVKKEPTTPASELGEVAMSVDQTPMPAKVARQRRGTLQSQIQSTGKRKRHSPSPPVEEHASEPSPQQADADESEPTYVPAPGNTIIASRNFPRMSTVILDEIRAHKYANYFQQPVREKDAEGYRDIIQRPQDLKSIKAAIAAGSKAISAATVSSTVDSPSGGGTPLSSSRDGGSVTLEKSADLMPPRAIVNSSQLEKEVLRMLANAVMFNPGDEGIVRDTREMAEEIEAKVRDWRGAERVEGTAGASVRGEDGGEEVGKGKRRKF